MAALKFFVLGSPRLERDGHLMHVERRRALALLAYLAVTGEHHQRDTLAALFWPEYDHTRARAALRRTLAALTKALGGQALEADRERIGVRRLGHRSDLWLDVDHFHTLLAMCRTHDHPEADVCAACLPPLVQAVGLYRGDFLAGFTLRDAPAFDDWQLFHAEALRGAFAGALERLVRGHSARDEFDVALEYARRWLALDPFHEPAHCVVMSLYAQMGKQHAALRQYAECVRYLERELGVSPQSDTTQLYEAIRDKRFTPAIAQAPPVPVIHQQPQAHGARVQNSREAAPAEQSILLLDRLVRGTLIGRERQVQQMRALWRRARDGEGAVLLISGEAGVGKTRLVRELVTVAKTSNVRLLTGACSTEGSSPYAPVAQLIRAALDTTSAAAHAMPDAILEDLLILAP
jgi:DNA-binding SARP family transcriptional activator